MTYTTIEEINTNPIYQPPSEWLINYKISTMIKDFFLNPTLLSSKEIKGYGHQWGHEFNLKITKEERDEIFGDTYCNNYKEYHGEFENFMKRLNPENQKIMLEEIEQAKCETPLTRSNIRLYNTFRGVYCHKLKRETAYIVSFSMAIQTIYKRYSLIKELEKISQFNYPNIYKYEYDIKKGGINKYIPSFTIIEKDFKLMSESKRDTYKRYFHTRPFECFEETGFEFLYARSGYSIDKKRLPNFNRGAVWNLKQALKMNKIPLKGLTKKDDIIKALMKI